MKLGLVAYLTCVFSTADAQPMHATDGDSGVAVTLLVQGNETWVGTDKVGCDCGECGAIAPGVLPDLATALDRRDFDVLPHGSTSMMASYSDRLVIRVPFGGAISGAKLGEQRDYLGATETKLSAAIESAAHTMVDKPASPGQRRAIVVLGDGCDDADAARRRELRSWLDDHDIELHAVIYKVKASCEGIPIRELTPNVTWVTTVENLASVARGTLASLDDRRVPDRRERGHSTTWWLISLSGLLALIALPFVIRRWYRSVATILR